MSQYLTMWLRGIGPAKVVQSDPKSGDLFFANAIPWSFGVLHEAAEREGVFSIFDYAEGHDEAQRRAEIEVYGKPEDELDDEDPEISDEMLARVRERASDIDPWYEPADGLETARALLQFFVTQTGRVKPGVTLRHQFLGSLGDGLHEWIVCWLVAGWPGEREGFKGGGRSVTWSVF